MHTNLLYSGKAAISSSVITSGVKAIALSPSSGWLKGWNGSWRRPLRGTVGVLRIAAHWKDREQECVCVCVREGGLEQ